MSIHFRENPTPRVYHSEGFAEGAGPKPGVDYERVSTEAEAQGKLPHTDLQDSRAGLEDGAGNMCIRIVVGDEELGDIAVTVNYEGPHGEYEQCMNGHNALLESTSKKLADILDEMFKGVEWEASVESSPCEKEKHNVAVREAMHILSRGETPVDVSGTRVEREHTVDNTASHEVSRSVGGDKPE